MGLSAFGFLGHFTGFGLGGGFSFLMIISTYIHTHYGLGSICIFLYVHCVLVFWFQEMDFGLCLLSVRPCRAGFPFLGSFSFFLGRPG